MPKKLFCPFLFCFVAVGVIRRVNVIRNRVGYIPVPARVEVNSLLSGSVYLPENFMPFPRSIVNLYV